MEVMTDMEKAEAVLALVDAFIVKQAITCAETVYQSDRVIEAAYEFIESLCNVAGYMEIDDDE